MRKRSGFPDGTVGAGRCQGSGWVPVVAALAGWALLVTCGCARGPAGGVNNAVNKLLVRVNVAGRIDDTLFYFVAFDDGGNPAFGPLPVVSSPFGNGWGTGTFTTFVRYHQGIYQVFGHRVNPDNTVADTFLDQPLFSVPPRGNQLEFTLDLNRVFAAGATQLNVNIFATDQILVDPNLQAIKREDGLGVTGTEYITFRIDRNGVFDNSIGLEPIGDIVNPDLDISNFRFEVQRQ